MLIVNLTSVKQSEAGRPGDEAKCILHAFVHDNLIDSWVGIQLLQGGLLLS